MQKVVPHLWFGSEARDAAEFYTGLFPNSRLLSTYTLSDTPSGEVQVVSFQLCGYSFQAISAGPEFRFNPSISFILNFDPRLDPSAEDRLRRTWEALTQDGSSLIPLDETLFSKAYGWVEDRYGLSWQLLLSDPSGDPRPFIIPALLFVGNVAGRAREALDLYLSVFGNSRRGRTEFYPAEMAPDGQHGLMYADFAIGDQWFALMDSFHPHGFGFSEAISLMVLCQDQAEIDYFWSKLSAFPEAEQCGWLKDRFGVSWQIVPEKLEAMLERASPEGRQRLTQSFLKMKKLDIAALERACMEH